MTYSSARFARRRRRSKPAPAAQDRRCCSTGSTSTPATACSRSAAAGGPWRSRRRSAACQVVGLTLSTEQKAWADARIAEAGLSDRDRHPPRRTIARSTNASTPSPRSKWSRRSASAIGPPISIAIARNLKPGGKAALQFISIDHRLFDRYAAQRRLHPGLHLPRRHADRRAALRSAGEGARPVVGATATASASIMPRPCASGATRYDAAVAARPPRRLRRGVPRPVALLSDVLRRRLPRRRDRRRAGDAAVRS